MSAMQAFHNWLFAPPDARDADKNRLACLTRASRDQFNRFASGLDWYVWGASQA